MASSGRAEMGQVLAEECQLPLCFGLPAPARRKLAEVIFAQQERQEVVRFVEAHHAKAELRLTSQVEEALCRIEASQRQVRASGRERIEVDEIRLTAPGQ